MYKNLSILITGANGLLGRSICENLRNQGNQIFGVVHNLPNDPLDGVTYITIDLGDHWSMDLLPSKTDVIIHLAQSAHFREFPEMAMNVFQVNIASTARLLDYGKNAGVKTFLFASSGGVYGNSSQAFHENSTIISPGKLGYYLGSKLSGEVLVQSYAAVFKVVVLRFFFIYGRYQKRGMLIPRLMDSVLNHKPIILQGTEGIRINPIHVEDACQATLAAIGTDESATINISGPQILSLRAIAEEMGDFLKIKPEFNFIAGETKDLIGDNMAMKLKLHVPQRLLKQHLQEIFDSIKDS